jgi:hypothetical protein
VFVVVLSSVPVTLGEETYDLLFTDRDMYDIDVAFQREGVPSLTDLLQEPSPRAFTRLNVLTTVMMFGLKVPGKFGPNGEPIRAIPSTRSGNDQMISILRAELAGKPVNYGNVFAYSIMRALAAGEWYNIAQMLKLAEDKAHASVPEGDSAPKNSEADGSNTSSR